MPIISAFTKHVNHVFSGIMRFFLIKHEANFNTQISLEKHRGSLLNSFYYRSFLLPKLVIDQCQSKAHWSHDQSAPGSVPPSHCHLTGSAHDSAQVPLSKLPASPGLLEGQTVSFSSQSPLSPHQAWHTVGLQYILLFY